MLECNQIGHLCLSWRSPDKSCSAPQTGRLWVYPFVSPESMRLLDLADLRKGRNSDYLRIQDTFTRNVSKGRMIINLFPPVLKPCVEVTTDLSTRLIRSTTTG